MSKKNYYYDVPSSKEEDIKLTLKIPKKMHTSFKTKCSANELKMKDVLVEAIVKYINHK